MNLSIRAVKAKLVTFGVLLVGAATVGMPAFAASTTATATIAVTATVQATCTIAATALPFGTYTGAAAVKVNATITTTCSKGTGYTIGLNGGTTTGGGTSTGRKMTGPGGATLNYQLFKDSGYATYWGNAKSIVTGTGTGAAVSNLVYGEILPSQYPTAGAYTDTVTATITY